MEERKSTEKYEAEERINRPYRNTRGKEWKRKGEGLCGGEAA